MNTRSCPICAGPLDGDGLCPACVEGSFDGRPSLSVDGTLAAPELPALEGLGAAPVPRPKAPPAPPVERTPPTVPPAPDPGHGVPLELELAAPPNPGSGLELDERALASIRARAGAGTVIPTVPVDRRPRPAKRRWPWVVAVLALVFAALALGAGAVVERVATRLAEGLLDRLGETGIVAGEKQGERALAPGIAGAILMIDSEPQGAAVYLGSELLGETPLAVDNPYSDGDRFEITVKKAGYLEARLAAEGGEPAHFNVKLVRRK